MHEIEVNEIDVVVGGVTFPPGAGVVVRPPILELPPPPGWGPEPYPEPM